MYAVNRVVVHSAYNNNFNVKFNIANGVTYLNLFICINSWKMCSSNSFLHSVVTFTSSQLVHKDVILQLFCVGLELGVSC